jgi:radical SAM superfamily enzyme YgiQ (UPF0313 family)
MRVLLISANTERINMVTMPLGLGLVASAARRAGHEVTFLDLLAATETGAAVRDTIATVRPEAIGISVRNIDDQSRREPCFLLEKVKDVVAECRANSNAPIVLGGAGYSIYPREVLTYLGADFGIRGDGEVAFPALLERLSKGLDARGVQGVHTAGGTDDGGLAVVADMDALPLWDNALSAYADSGREEIWVPVQSRRGCPNDCSYCSTSSIQGRRIRSRSPRLVVDAINDQARRGFRHFYFVDNSFNIPEQQALALCRELNERKLGVAWRCILYPHHVREELVKAMADAGCVEVSLGFESGSPAVLRQMHKRFSPDEVRRASDVLAAHRIRRMGFLLLGGPGETRETVEESLAFASSLGLDDMKVTVGIRIYPQTPLARLAVEEGVIDSEKHLLRPAFYLAPGLEPWIYERLATLGIAVK